MRRRKGATQKALEDLDATVDAYHRALDTFLRGDPAPLHALYSRRDDVVIANPFGPPQRGWSAVEKTTAQAAAYYRDGRSVGFEEVSMYVTPELACTVELERYESRVGGSDTLARLSVRVTTVFRREEDGWKVAHRHADPITSARPAESVVEG